MTGRDDEMTEAETFFLEEMEADPIEKGLDDWLWFNNLSVMGEVTLKMPIKTTRIEIYAADVRWHCKTEGEKGLVTKATGTGRVANDEYKYPSARVNGIVLLQGNRYWNIGSQNQSDPTVITGLTNVDNIRTAVNDKRRYYGDNWGAFDLFLRFT